MSILAAILTSGVLMSLIALSEVNKHHRLSVSLLNFLCFGAGLAVLWIFRVALG